MGKGNKEAGPGRAVRSLWLALGRTRLAAILLAALLLATLLASLFPQMPVAPAAQEAWLSAVGLRYGAATGLLRGLGLFQVYHSPWYLGLLALLLLNILACTLQRLPRLWRAMTRPPDVARPEAFYEAFSLRSRCPVTSLADGMLAAQSILARHRYHSHFERNELGTRAHFYAEKRRWAQAGTIISHVAALVLALAVLARPALGWQQTGLVLVPGQAYEPGHGRTFAIRTGDLTIDLHPGGQPSDYRVPLTILEDGETRVKTVGLNRPLTHRGVAFHLQSYGPAARLTAPGGEVTLAFTGSQEQQTDLPGTGLSLQVAYLPQDRSLFVVAFEGESPVGSGQVMDGQEIEIQGTPVTFSLGHYTAWQVSHDPTGSLAIGAALLMLGGIAVSLWLPHRRLWLLLDCQGVRMVAAGDFGGRFDSLVAELDRACQAEEAGRTEEIGKVQGAVQGDGAGPAKEIGQSKGAGQTGEEDPAREVKSAPLEQSRG